MRESVRLCVHHTQRGGGDDDDDDDCEGRLMSRLRIIECPNYPALVCLCWGMYARMHAWTKVLLSTGRSFGKRDRGERERDRERGVI